MSIQEFVQAMPKVELHVHLEGMIRQETLLMIADQNEITRTHDDYDFWIQMLNSPDYDRVDELTRTLNSWVHEPEDLARFVYDLGVDLSKQGVRYAEVSVNPVLYLDHLTFEQFLAAINDGRDRAYRGWQIRMAWILVIPRDEPRRADEIARWATGAFANKAGIVALGLSGPEDVQPAAQFERAFRIAEKKFLTRAPHAGSKLGSDGIQDVLDVLEPDRIFGGWGVLDKPDLVEKLGNQQIPLNLSMVSALRDGRIANYEEYPLQQLYDAGLLLTLGSDMGRIYQTTLNEQYLQAIEACGLSVDELEVIALNAVRTSALTDDEKEALEGDFQESYGQLRAEHLAELDVL